MPAMYEAKTQPLLARAAFAEGRDGSVTVPGRAPRVLALVSAAARSREPHREDEGDYRADSPIRTHRTSKITSNRSRLHGIGGLEPGVLGCLPDARRLPARLTSS